MWRAFLLSAAACAGLAAATSQAVDSLRLDQTPGPVARRYCSCHYKGNRYTRTYQTCVVRKDMIGGHNCKSETLPYVDRSYKYSEGGQILFKLFNNLMTFYDARNVCNEEYARLAVPQNKDGFSDIYDEIKRRGYKEAMLGFSDRRREGTFVDPDGLAVPRLPWGQDIQPDSLHDEDCVRLFGKYHLNDKGCYGLEALFVCERRMMLSIPKGYFYSSFQQRFYKFYGEQKTHAAARKRCEQDHGTLAAFESWSQADEIIGRSGVKELMWVDYTDEEVEGRFVTSSGMLMEDTDFINWYLEQPDNGGNSGTPENCVAIRNTGEHTDEVCGRVLPFICQIKKF